MILLTGATGFLGSKLLRELINKKYKIVCIKRSTSDCSRVKDIFSECEWFDNDEDNIEEVFRKNKIDIIIHCATNYGRIAGEGIKVYDSNLAFPLKLVQYALKYGCKYFINTDSFFVREIQSLWVGNEVVYMDAYAKSKYIFTHIIKDQINEIELAFINLQLEHIYGPGDGKGKFVESLIMNLLNNVPKIELTEGLQKRDWIYVDDVVSAYITVLEKINNFSPKQYYHFEVGTGVETSLREFVEAAKKITNSTTELEFGKRPMNTNELKNSCADNRKLSDLGWIPHYDILSGIKEICKFEGYYPK